MPDKYWNYRVMRKKFSINDTEYTMYGIYEVYYRCGKPSNWSQDAQPIVTDDSEEITQTLNKMIRGATEFPILDHATGEEIA